MTIDEDAAKRLFEISKHPHGYWQCTIGPCLIVTGHTKEEIDRWMQPLYESYAAFGRRCVEQMREECVKALAEGSDGVGGDWGAPEAVRSVQQIRIT